VDIGYLVHLLDSNIVTIREYSAIAVSILVQSEACKACLIGECFGVVAPLIRLLESGTSVGKEKAAEALLGLTVVNRELIQIDMENAWAISSHGGLSALVKICRHGSLELQAIGSAVLRNLAYVEDIRGLMAEEGAIPLLINLVISGPAPAQESSAECLHLLAANHENLRQMICREGGVESLVLLLERAPNPQVQEIALRAIHKLSASNCSTSLLMSSRFVNQLRILLKSGSSAIQELAASVICNLSQEEESKRALGEAGCIGLLAKMLDGKPSFSQETAVRALSSLFVVESNRKEFIKDDENVSCLVQLLDPQNGTVAKAVPISALLALSHSNSGKRKIASAGACLHLEKLADMEVGGAKKILRKITGSRLSKVFSAKW
jgi:vacuolar protein 8